MLFIPIGQILQSPEAGIKTVRSQQFVVGTAFTNTAMMQNMYPVGSAHRAQTMGDNQCATPFTSPVHLSLDQRLGAGIETTGRFIENDDGGL